MSTHAELVQRAVRWLRSTRGCGVVLWERSSAARETPDAIGWKGGFSTLVEVKVSRSDFLRDRHKASRRKDLEEHVGPAMGTWRFYLTPPGLLDPCELEAVGWGLLEAEPGRAVRVRRDSKQFTCGLRDEIRLVVSELRLVQMAQDGHAIKPSARARHALRGLQVRWKDDPLAPEPPTTSGLV